MNLETQLGSLPVSEWVTKRTIALGWYDGPLEGICSLVVPGCEFYFKLLDERYNPDGLDDRLYRVSELPAGSVAKVETALEVLGRALNPVWVPVWKFPSEAARQEAEQSIKSIQEIARATSLVVLSQDMEHFEGCWRVDPGQTDIKDWFAALGIPPREPAAEDQPA